MLVIGPKPFSDGAFEYLDAKYSNVTFKTSDELAIRLIDGYRLLVKDPVSRLGWRILLHTHMPDGWQRWVEQALERQAELRDLLDPAFLDEQMAVVGLLERIVADQGETEHDLTEAGLATGLSTADLLEGLSIRPTVEPDRARLSGPPCPTSLLSGQPPGPDCPASARESGGRPMQGGQQRRAEGVGARLRPRSPYFCPMRCSRGHYNHAEGEAPQMTSEGSLSGLAGGMLTRAAIGEPFSLALRGIQDASQEKDRPRLDVAEEEEEWPVDGEANDVDGRGLVERDGSCRGSLRAEFVDGDKRLV